ncbi:hypothetical protein EJB05_21579, partial [Eragrostis curvula]
MPRSPASLTAPRPTTFTSPERHEDAVRQGGKGGGGGKIHPAHVQEDPIRAAFRLLPSAILVLVVGLGTEARELLAYFVTCPLDDWLAKDAAAPTSVAARGGDGGRGGGGTSRRRVGCAPPAFWVASHPPTFGCGCVDCYFSFWARWDRSPERDRISEALSAFEDHLAASAATTPPSSSKRREKGKRRKLHATPPPPPAPPLPTPPRRATTPAPKAVQVVPEPDSPLPFSCPPPPPTPSAPTWSAAAAAKQQEVNVVVPEPAAKAEAEECREMAAAEVKRGWADVLMGGGLGRTLKGMLFNQPAVLSAT